MKKSVFCLQKSCSFVKKILPSQFSQNIFVFVHLSSHKGKSHQNKAEHHQNKQKQKSKQRVQRHLVAKI